MAVSLLLLTNPSDPCPLAVTELSQQRWHQGSARAVITGVSLSRRTQFISCVSPVDTPQRYYQAVNPGLQHLRSPGNG